MVPELERVPPAWLTMPLLPPEFDIVMVSKLLMVPKLLMPKPAEFDIVMVPELLMVAPMPLKMPLPPEVDIVMVPELVMVPSLLIVPVDVISMVPPTLFVRV